MVGAEAGGAEEAVSRSRVSSEKRQTNELGGLEAFLSDGSSGSDGPNSGQQRFAGLGSGQASEMG